MKRDEIKAAIKQNYNVVMAAIKVNEANDAYEAAEKAHQATPYDFTHKTSNDDWLLALEKLRKAEGNLKKAVNAFFKVVGRPTHKWNLGIEAKYAFNDYIKETGWGSTEKPIKDINLYSLKCQ